MTTFSPVTEARIRSIQSAASDRAAKRAELASKHKDEETRETISPNDVLAREKHIAACLYWQNFYEAERQEEHRRQRNADIATMAALKAEWEIPETTPHRRGRIVKMYADLYAKYVPGVTAERVLSSWQDEKRKAALAKIFGGTNGTGKV